MRYEELPEELKNLVDSARPYVSDINVLIQVVVRAYNLGRVVPSLNA